MEQKNQQKNKYTATELASVLGVKEETIDSYNKLFSIPGKTGMGILLYYSLGSGYFILERMLEKEMQAKNKKKAKTIRKAGPKIIVSKKSLESLIKTAKITGTPLSAKVEDPQYDGSDYAGTIRYIALPDSTLEFRFEQTYRVDKITEVSEIIHTTREALAKIKNKHSIQTQYA